MLREINRIFCHLIGPISVGLVKAYRALEQKRRTSSRKGPHPSGESIITATTINSSQTPKLEPAPIVQSERIAEPESRGCHVKLHEIVLELMRPYDDGSPRLGSSIDESDSVQSSSLRESPSARRSEAPERSWACLVLP